MNLKLLNVKKWVNIKKWFNRYIIGFLLFICFIFLLYNLFVKSYEGLGLGLGSSESNDLSNIKTWYFNKSTNWYNIKRGVDLINFEDTGLSTDNPEITITFLFNNTKGYAPYWRNIFQFTNNGHACCDKGARVPGMWVIPYGDDNYYNFHISSSTENNGNDWFNTSNNLLIGVPVFICIVVKQNEIEYYINKELIMTKTYNSDILNRIARTQLYIGNPWEGVSDNTILIKHFRLYDAALTKEQIKKVDESMTYVNYSIHNVMEPMTGANDNNGLSFTIYDGYFDDRMSFFKDARTLDSGSATNFININTATEEKIIVDRVNLVSVVWKGYFLPDVTSDKWRFGLNSDDASYMWIDQKGEYRTDNATIKNGNLHGMIVVQSEYISLTKGTYYPIQIVFGQNYGGADLKFFYTVDDSRRIYDFDGKFFKEAIMPQAVSSPSSGQAFVPASAPSSNLHPSGQSAPASAPASVPASAPASGQSSGQSAPASGQSAPASVPASAPASGQSAPASVPDAESSIFSRLTRRYTNI